MFALDWKALALSRAVAAVVILSAVVVVLELVDQQEYVLTVVFAVLYVGISDPGGAFGNGATRMGIFAVLGALLTLLGFGVGGGGWGVVVLAAFLVTLLCGLAVKYGVHRFVAGILLNSWFIIAIVLPVEYKLDRISTHAWSRRWPGSRGQRYGSRSPAFCGWRAGAHRAPRRFPRFLGTSRRGN